MEISLSSNGDGAYAIKNPSADKGTLIVLGNCSVAYVRGRSASEIGKNEVTCTVLNDGNKAVLKHAARKGAFYFKHTRSKEQLYFRPGTEDGNVEFHLEKSCKDQYAFSLFLVDPKDMSIRYFLMPETDNSESGIVELKEGRPQDEKFNVFGSSISMKFTK